MDTLALAASGSIFLFVLVGALAVYSRSSGRLEMRGRLEGIIAGTTSVVESDAIHALRESRTPLAIMQFLFSGGWLPKMNDDLRRADSNLQAVDFMAIRVALAGLGFAAPFILVGGLVGVLAGLAGALVGFMIPQMWMKQRRGARSKKLEEQLPDALTLISNSLKSGFGLLQALSLASEQIEHPLATELGTAIHEMKIGSNVEEALIELSGRVGSYDLDMVVTAILVQRSVGGNLGEILDTVAETMRERVRIKGEIKTLTAQQSMTGMVIGMMPVGVGAMFLLISPEYITVLFTEPLGQVMLGAALALETVGIMIIRRILDIEV